MRPYDRKAQLRSSRACAGDTAGVRNTLTHDSCEADAVRVQGHCSMHDYHTKIYCYTQNSLAPLPGASGLVVSRACARSRRENKSVSDSRASGRSAAGSQTGTRQTKNNVAPPGMI